MKRVRVKPGKGSSLAGFIGGIAFVFIGIFVVIPVFGLFGIVWTLLAAGIAAVSGVNAFTEKGVASHEILIDEDVQGQDDTAARLQRLRGLYEDGLITQEEYEKRRAEILQEL